MASTAASKERQRCIKIVRKYRDELTAAYARKPFAANAAKVLALIHRLSDMMNEMAQTPRDELSVNFKSAMPALEGGFTIEEMERAAALIAEQEHNPFIEEE